MIKESDWNERYPRPRRRRRRRGCLTRLVTTVLVLGLLVGWFWWQQNGLSSETITVSSAPDGFDGYRIAVVSDLHAKEFGEGNRVLLDYVRDLEPDLVAVVGDILHEPDQMSMIPAVAKGLAAIAPTYYVTGNHEWAAGVVRELEPLLEQCGVTVLSNEYVMLERNGDRRTATATPTKRRCRSWRTRSGRSRGRSMRFSSATGTTIMNNTPRPGWTSPWPATPTGASSACPAPTGWWAPSGSFFPSILRDCTTCPMDRWWSPGGWGISSPAFGC